MKIWEIPSLPLPLCLVSFVIGPCEGFPPMIPSSSLCLDSIKVPSTFEKLILQPHEIVLIPWVSSLGIICVEVLRVNLLSSKWKGKRRILPYRGCSNTFYSHIKERIPSPMLWLPLLSNQSLIYQDSHHWNNQAFFF